MCFLVEKLGIAADTQLETNLTPAEILQKIWCRDFNKRTFNWKNHNFKNLEFKKQIFLNSPGRKM